MLLNKLYNNLPHLTYILIFIFILSSVTMNLDHVLAGHPFFHKELVNRSSVVTLQL